MPQVKEHNAETNEITIREMNDDEFKEYEELQKKSEASKQAETQAATDKVALLIKLGINSDEAKLLLS